MIVSNQEYIPEEYPKAIYKSGVPGKGDCVTVNSKEEKATQEKLWKKGKSKK